MTFFMELCRQTESERQQLLSAPIIQRGLCGQITLEEYVAFLSQAYHHVKYTVPLLMATGARLDEKLEWLREAIAEYIEEETGHQEWILNDIAACGYDKEAVRVSEPGFATELMVSYAWDTVQRGNPVGFFWHGSCAGRNQYSPGNPGCRSDSENTGVTQTGILLFIIPWFSGS